MNLPQRIKFIYFIVLLPTFAYAEDCSEVDLRVKGGSMEFTQARNQGSRTNTCSFHTASQLIDAWRALKNIDPTQTSNPYALATELALRRDLPIWFPIQNSTDGLSNQNLRSGGTVCASIRQAQKEGVCLQKSYQDLTLDQSGVYGVAMANIYRTLHQYGRLSKSKREELRQMTSEQVMDFIKDLPIQISQQEILGLLNTNSRNPYEVIRKLFQKDCEADRTAALNLPSCQSKVFGKLKTIHEEMSKANALPPSIAYCAEVMFQGLSYKRGLKLGKGCMLHWAAIIGRKKINGRCHFLIRNSIYKKDRPFSSDWTMDRDDLWIDSEALNRSTYLIQYLQ